MKSIELTLERKVMLQIAPPMAAPFRLYPWDDVHLHWVKSVTYRHMDDNLRDAHGRVMNAMGIAITRRLHNFNEP